MKAESKGCLGLQNSKGPSEKGADNSFSPEMLQAGKPGQPDGQIFGSGEILTWRHQLRGSGHTTCVTVMRKGSFPRKKMGGLHGVLGNADVYGVSEKAMPVKEGEEGRSDRPGKPGRDGPGGGGEQPQQEIKFKDSESQENQANRPTKCDNAEVTASVTALEG